MSGGNAEKNRPECDCGLPKVPLHGAAYCKCDSPLATASAELAEKGTPLVADIREFKGGATRDSDEGKYDIEAFFNPIVTQRRAEYMHKHRKQSDGAMRDGDNWQSGMPYRESLKSYCRHTEDIKLISRGYEVFEKDKHGEFKLEDGEKIPVTIQDAICAAHFNLDSMLLTRLEDKPTEIENSCDNCYWYQGFNCSEKGCPCEVCEPEYTQWLPIK